MREIVLSSRYLVSNQNVFFAFTGPARQVDAASFRTIGAKGPVAVDRDHALWGTSRFEADPGTLSCVLPGLLYKDSKAVYAYGAKLVKTDAASFRLLKHPLPWLALATDDHQRFIFESLTGGFMTQEEPLAANPAKLKKVLSITRVPIEGSESDWIEQVRQAYVPAEFPPGEEEETAMVLTDEGCRLETRRRVPCDPASFEALTDDTGRDKDHFFRGAAIMSEIDRDSVEHIGGSFFKDRNHVFCLWGPYTPVPKADPKSFRLIEPYFHPVRYATDDTAGFCLMFGSQSLKIKRFTLPDPKALRSIEPAYGSDGAVFGLATDGITTFKDGVPLKSAPQPT
ncbi:DKNYY domain-containing protein [Microvirga guangxiensis]|uniref:DKNYY family n=1 Tax=Microvirga guangxiensis TaxID=549386 RepID=A0A1G5FA29_9HYPH|nr:DKNYY domain-containing protein [Microvirga guangxiensis]SCY36057.1 DKNYY family [Microvirga guangxiensis]